MKKQQKMPEERKRIFVIICTGTLVVLPLCSGGIYLFGLTTVSLYYLIAVILTQLFVLILTFIVPSSLFSYFVIGFLSLFSSAALGFILLTAALVVMAFGSIVNPDLLFWSTLIYFGAYCYFPLKYYHHDFIRTRKARLKSFDFEMGTYDIRNPSIIRGDSFADYYSQSFLAKAHIGVIRFYLIFPVGGGAIAIIAGKISHNLQLGLGMAAAFLTSIFFLQICIPGFYNAWQVRQLEKEYGKKISIVYGDDDE